MNFQDLQNVEDSQFYLDLALKKSEQRIKVLRTNIKLKSVTRVIKSKRIEIEKLKIIKEILCEKLSAIHTKFPSIDGLPEFYYQLIKLNINIDDLKKALGSVAWAKQNISKIILTNTIKIKGSKVQSEISKLGSSALGRVSSIMKQINKFLLIIENSRRIMKTFPAVKTSLYTIAIAGFPNVGKSTLLMELTSASPEINSYAFTTKILNIGYLKVQNEKYQFIDTPGTLARFDKMNTIEQRAFLAIKYIANVIVFIYDLSNEAYSLEDQDKLFEQIEDIDKPIIVYLSKTDIADKKKVDEFISKHKNLNVIVDKKKIINEVLKIEKNVFEE